MIFMYLFCFPLLLLLFKHTCRSLVLILCYSKPPFAFDMRLHKVAHILSTGWQHSHRFLLEIDLHNQPEKERKKERQKPVWTHFGNTKKHVTALTQPFAHVFILI